MADADAISELHARLAAEGINVLPSTPTPVSILLRRLAEDGLDVEPTDDARLAVTGPAEVCDRHADEIRSRRDDIVAYFRIIADTPTCRTCPEPADPEYGAEWLCHDCWLDARL